MINLPKFKIRNLEINLIQGGMGVGISLRNLVSAVADQGGAGIIASVGIGALKNYPGSYIEANKAALRDEIKATKKMTNGVIGVNIMYALFDHDDLVQVAVEEDIKLFITGAGMALGLPKLIKDKSTNLVPIVSSKRAAKIITRAWKRYDKVPDAFIVEGPMAGGHLGFKYEDLVNNTAPKLEDIAKEVIDFANNPSNFKNSVPVIVAGGIYTGEDLARYQKLGAVGVQMATRFVTTLECDANDKFKQEYVNATKKDIQIIESPVGLPGRAIKKKDSFLEKVKRGEIKCGFKCLKSCDPKKSPYCIAEALINAQRGDLEKGFAFAGANAYKCTPETCLDEEGKFISVETLMQRISDEYNFV